MNTWSRGAASPASAGGPGGNRSTTSLSCSITLSCSATLAKRATRSACRSSMASSSALAWSVSIRCRRATCACRNSFGSRSAAANSSRPRAMVSAAACESSDVRPSRGGRQAAIRSARSSTVPRPATFQVCGSSSSFRTAANSAWVRSTEMPVAALTRRLMSSVRRSLLNQRWAAPASASADQFTGTATAAGPSPAPSSHASTTRDYLPRRAHRREPKKESGTKWGRLRCERHGIRGLAEAGILAAEVAGELVVEDAGADLQSQVCAARGPAHLLFLYPALADDLVRGTSQGGKRNCLSRRGGQDPRARAREGPQYASRALWAWPYSSSAARCRYTEARLTPRALAISIGLSPRARRALAAASLSASITVGRPPWRP